jgi:twitching motility protein PilI
MPAQIAPFAVLSDIAKRSKSFAEGLPAQEEAVELWNGIGFTLAGERFVAPMGEVIEILHLPRVTQIPGVKHWMLGLANVRGRLLPVMDLGNFFNLAHTSMSSRDKRVLVVEHGETLSGLVVDSVQGMQYFAADSFHETVENVSRSMAPCINGAYTKNNEIWKIFSAFTLTKSPDFMNLSLWGS